MRRRFYAGLLLTVVLGLVAVAAAPEPTMIVLSIAVPISIAAAVVATLYLRRVFLAQPIPRSRFFRMVLELFSGLLAVGAWVGYLTVARLTERAHVAGTIGWSLPAPGPAHSAPISALIVIAVFASPVRFALEVWRVRRRSARAPEPTRRDTLEREIDLDRD